MKFVVFASILVAACTAQLNVRARNFCLELLQHVANETSGHAVISPFGIWSIMAGVTLSATDNSQTQLATAMKLPKLKIKEFALDFQNFTSSVFHQTSSEVTVINKNFLFLDRQFTLTLGMPFILRNYLGLSMEPLDFQNTIGASQKANRLIRSAGVTVAQVLKPDDFKDSRMIMINVITFKGAWKIAFDKTATTVEPFYNDNKQVIGSVNMMYQSMEVPFSYIDGLKANVIELAYGRDGKYSMLIMVPKASNTLRDLYQKVERTDLVDVMNKLRKDEEEMGSVIVDVRIPRFKIMTTLFLNNVLRKMGVTDIFEPTAANFGNITPEKIYLSSVLHKAEIEVTETGTVASASTSANFADRILSPNFTANKPFMYFIVEKSTTSIIFGGTYSQPSLY